MPLLRRLVRKDHAAIAFLLDGQAARRLDLFHAFGFAGAGFQIAPGVGEVLAELIRDGESPTPIGAFSISRFTREPQRGVPPAGRPMS
ncbi:glycine/D-amino acid oxidase-like deaminating enzyme [Bosea sp. BE125]|uniref:hypothetical protein n=1 Tax=Bosea sp. BE125 TaxID=2817909 RepID=UPI002862EEDE|nr:glycine/D-amino acid oxidase-like deaminating enzyme [Bosea sp. BE125]